MENSKTKDIIIIGASGQGKETAFLISRINTVKPTWNILGFADDGIPAGSTVYGYKVLCTVDEIKTLGKVSAVIAVGYPRVRKSIYERLSKNSAIEFPSLIDPSAVISDSVSVGEGTVICAGCVITVDIKIGRFALIDYGCTVGHDTTLGDFTTLFPSANVAGLVNIGELCELGSGCSVIQCLNIGNSVRIGAKAAVIRSLPDDVTAVGVPAKILSER